METNSVDPLADVDAARLIAGVTAFAAAALCVRYDTAVHADLRSRP